MSRFNAQIAESTFPIKSLIEKAFTALLLTISLFMLITSNKPQGTAATIRMAISDVMLPVVNALSAPAQAVQSVGDYIDNVIFVFHENRQLRLENERLMQWHHTARSLAQENASLRNLMAYQPSTSSKFISAKVIGNMGSNLSHSALIDAGSTQGVELNQAVINEYGLVGRVIEVGKQSARILLITDINSRIPVILEPSGTKTILAGDRSDMPQLHFLDAKNLPELGAHIVTASDGGVFPAGLPVGKLFSHSNNRWSVKPYTQLGQLSFVRVVDFSGYEMNVPAQK